MPKMKTHRGAKKRFKITGTGKVRRRAGNLNHILEKKSPVPILGRYFISLTEMFEAFLRDSFARWAASYLYLP